MFFGFVCFFFFAIMSDRKSTFADFLLYSALKSVQSREAEINSEQNDGLR